MRVARCPEGLDAADPRLAMGIPASCSVWDCWSDRGVVYWMVECVIARDGSDNVIGCLGVCGDRICCSPCHCNRPFTQTNSHGSSTRAASHHPTAHRYPSTCITSPHPVNALSNQQTTPQSPLLPTPHSPALNTEHLSVPKLSVILCSTRHLTAQAHPRTGSPRLKAPTDCVVHVKRAGRMGWDGMVRR